MQCAGFGASSFAAPDPIRSVKVGDGKIVVANGRSKLDPGCLPVAGAEQTHRPNRRLAPWSGASVLVPDAHFPIAGGSARQWLARILDVDRLIRRHLASVP